VVRHTALRVLHEYRSPLTVPLRRT
jgi:hypothetical protein